MCQTPTLIYRAKILCGSLTMREGDKSVASSSVDVEDCLRMFDWC
jgi:hypothetical protein